MGTYQITGFPQRINGFNFRLLGRETWLLISLLVSVRDKRLAQVHLLIPAWGTKCVTRSGG